MTATAQLGLGERERLLTSLPDEDLVRRLDEAIDAVDDFYACDRLYALASEVVERWSPQAEWALRLARLADEEPASRQDELQAVREAMANRAAARVRALGAIGGRS